MEVGMKRKSESNVDVEVRIIKLYRFFVVDVFCFRSFIFRESENGNYVYFSYLKFKFNDV